MAKKLIGRRHCSVMSSRAKDFEPTRILHPWALLMGSWGYFTPPPNKKFLPPQKNQKNSYLIKKQNRGNGVWGRFFKSKFASDASFLRYLQKTKNLIFLHRPIRFRETLQAKISNFGKNSHWVYSVQGRRKHGGSGGSCPPCPRGTGAARGQRVPSSWRYYYSARPYCQ